MSELEPVFSERIPSRSVSELISLERFENSVPRLEIAVSWLSNDANCVFADGSSTNSTGHYDETQPGAKNLHASSHQPGPKNLRDAGYQHDARCLHGPKIRGNTQTQHGDKPQCPQTRTQTRSGAATQKENVQG